MCALISIAWALTSYHRSVRFARDDKEKLSWQGSTIQFCWHLMGTGRTINPNFELYAFLGDFEDFCLIHFLGLHLNFSVC